MWHYFRWRANREGCCWPGYDLICEELRCNRDTLKVWIQLLCVRGYLRVQKMGQRHSNRYYVLCGSQKTTTRISRSSQNTTTGSSQKTTASGCQNTTGTLVQEPNPIEPKQEVEVLPPVEPSPPPKTEAQLRQEFKLQVIEAMKQCTEPKINGETRA